MGVATSKSTTKARGPWGGPWRRDATLDPCRPNTCSSADLRDGEGSPIEDMAFRCGLYMVNIW